MTYPLAGLPGSPAGPPGCSYAAVLVPAGRRDEVVAVLRRLRVTGWLIPPGATSPAAAGAGGGGADGVGWLVVATAATRTVAAGRRGVVELGAALAGRSTALALRVSGDRQLVLVAWRDGAELGRYVSDPSYGAGADVLPDPLGTGLAPALAAACGRPEVAGDLAELLAETLDPDSVNETERLDGVLRLLGLPRWLVALDSLPRDIPTGPRAADLTRYGAGVPGWRGRLPGAAAALLRRRPPPPVVTDPPRSSPDPWYL